MFPLRRHTFKRILAKTNAYFTNFELLSLKINSVRINYISGFIPLNSKSSLFFALTNFENL
jgi:hypothetical protein